MTSPIPSGVRDVTGTSAEPRMGRQNPPRGTIMWDTSNAGAVQIVVSGAMFDGRVRATVAAMIEEMKYRIAAQLLSEVMHNLDRSIQHPTPYYETQIMLQRQADTMVVHDRKIVYGPWLEGVSSRNKTTSFKGYHSFRRAADEIRRQAPEICKNVARQFAGRLSQ